jgi:hypothetical protein
VDDMSLWVTAFVAKRNSELSDVQKKERKKNLTHVYSRDAWLALVTLR